MKNLAWNNVTCDELEKYPIERCCISRHVFFFNFYTRIIVKLLGQKNLFDVKNSTEN